MTGRSDTDISDENHDCPICLDPFEVDELNFYPCACGYQLCRFCWHRIKNDENGLCPACRNTYTELPASFQPPTEEQILNFNKLEKRQPKATESRQKLTDSRKHLANIRVVQRCLVFVVGLSPKIADPDLLKRQEYFGKFGKIVKCVVNNNNAASYVGNHSPSLSAFITFSRPEDALRAIEQINSVQTDGRCLKGALGTTKYCSQFLKGQQCCKNECMYLHQQGEEAASFTKEDMQQGKHTEYEQKLHKELHFKNLESKHLKYHKREIIEKDAYVQKCRNNLSPTLSSDRFDDWNPSTAETRRSNSSSALPVNVASLSKSSEELPTLCRHSSYSSTKHSLPNTSNFCSDSSELCTNFTANQGLFASSQCGLLDSPKFHNAVNGFLQYASEEDNNSGYLMPRVRECRSFWEENVKVDDELGFDPFDECQKGLEELMERELRISEPPKHHLLGDKEWQDGLRALLPNVSISFGSQSTSWPSRDSHLSSRDMWQQPLVTTDFHSFPPPHPEDPAIISASQRPTLLSQEHEFRYNHNSLGYQPAYGRGMQDVPSASHFNPPPGFRFAAAGSIIN